MLNIQSSRYKQTVDPDQTAPIKAVWSGSTQFAILSVLLDTSKDIQTDLVKFYVNYGAKYKYIL